jgi:hypothetical protein
MIYDVLAKTFTKYMAMENVFNLYESQVLQLLSWNKNN